MAARFSSLIVVFCSTCVFAESTSVNVDFDRWMYPFNITGGVRATGSTFGAVMNPVFDDRDAQVLVGFDTSAAILSGQSPANYQINSVTVVLSTATPTDTSFELDSTSDLLASYLDASLDSDAGRPIELFGVGTRNGFSALSLADAGAGPPFFEENESFAFPGPPASEARHAFASDYAGGVARDVSNNVRNSMDVTPWAVGTVDDLAEGTKVPVDSEMTFALDLSNSDVVNYLQNGLHDGALFFAATSMHGSTQGSSDGIPLFHLADATGASAGQVAQLAVDYSIVPEPSAHMMLLLSICGIVHQFRRVR